MVDNTKVKANIDELNKLIRVLKKESKVRIGIIGSAAEHDGRLTNSGAISSKLIFKLPGETPYKVLTNSKALSNKLLESSSKIVKGAFGGYGQRKSLTVRRNRYNSYDTQTQ